LGCYTDDGAARALTNQIWTIPGASVTVEACEAACLAAGYSLAGVEYGRKPFPFTCGRYPLTYWLQLMSAIAVMLSQMRMYSQPMGVAIWNVLVMPLRSVVVRTGSISTPTAMEGL
jgi:hypothetical protein